MFASKLASCKRSVDDLEQSSLRSVLQSKLVRLAAAAAAAAAFMNGYFYGSKQLWKRAS